MQESRTGSYVKDPMGSKANGDDVTDFNADIEAALLDPDTNSDAVVKTIRELYRDIVDGKEKSVAPSTLSMNRVEGAGAYGNNVNPNVVLQLHPVTPRPLATMFAALHGLVRMQDAQFRMRRLKGGTELGQMQQDIAARTAAGEIVPQSIVTSYVADLDGKPISREQFGTMYDIIKASPEIEGQPQRFGLLDGATYREGKVIFSNLEYHDATDEEFAAQLNDLGGVLPSNWGVFTPDSFTSEVEYLDGAGAMAEIFRGRVEYLRRASNLVREQVLPVYERWAAAAGEDVAAVRESVLRHADWLDSVATKLEADPKADIPPHPGKTPEVPDASTGGMNANAAIPATALIPPEERQEAPSKIEADMGSMAALAAVAGVYSYRGLNPRQIARLSANAAKLLNNPNFVDWFGKSRIVDKDGLPRILFHGTKADFDTADINKGELGFHFGEQQQAADFVRPNNFSDL